MVFSADRVKTKAVELGFNLVGITRAIPSPQLAAYERWVAAGMQGEMNYMGRPDRAERRRDLNVILPGVQSMVVVGLDYRTTIVPDEILHNPARGRIASYAWGLDYHDILTPRLEQFASWMEAEAGLMSHRVYVDTGAILERSHGYSAGLGFTGKNTMLIHPRRGSYFFLGEILTDIEFDEYDKPKRATMCGSCTRCLSACPTDAFPEPHVLDARRCISYLTIEHKGWINRELRPLMGNWIYGCDVCQEVCPFQRFATSSAESAFYAADVNSVAPALMDILGMDENLFRTRYHGTPIYRIKRERLVRNACIAAGNWGHEDAIPALKRLLTDGSALVRGHAVWGLWRIMGEDVKTVVRDVSNREHDVGVREELAAIGL